MMAGPILERSLEFAHHLPQDAVETGLHCLEDDQDVLLQGLLGCGLLDVGVDCPLELVLEEGQLPLWFVRLEAADFASGEGVLAFAALFRGF